MEAAVIAHAQPSHRARTVTLKSLAAAALLVLTAAVPRHDDLVDLAMAAKIQPEGLAGSRVMEFESYMADVLGARLTMSRDMQRAQTWVQGQMRSMGLVNVAAEPFMDFGG